ncbi:MAG: AAA family ATPase [Syntrophothermus sp.]
MLGDKRLIQSIKFQNFLSFGPVGTEIELKSLNVLIGPNGSGKSNLVEAIDFLRATPKDLTLPIREGGGVTEWLWKGSKETPTAELDVTIFYPDGIMPLRHKISFTRVDQRVELVDEAVENEHPEAQRLKDVRFFYRYQQGRPVLSVYTEPLDQNGGLEKQTERKLRREDIALDQSILSQRKDPDLYPEITYLANQYSKIKLYREWNVGRYTPPRLPQKVDLPEDFLLEDASNLGLILNDLEHQQGWGGFLERLGQFHEAFSDISTKIHGGTIQVFLYEFGMNTPIPATRLSDGTLRYLCLLSILCHPSPPPLICIEEPEMGLHPDILPTIADLLVEASHRTQLIVTTHSEVLVDALTKTPEAVIICEKHDGSTDLRRIDADALNEWLKKYTLGELWRKGELGGNRW